MSEELIPLECVESALARRSAGLVKRPIAQTPKHRTGGNAKVVGPVLCNHSLAGKLNPAIAPRISRLLPVRRPSAIARRIVSVVVDAIYAVSGGRCLAHVGKELPKGSPFRRNGYPASTIVRILRMLRIFAALPHMLPCAPFFGVAELVGIAARAPAALRAEKYVCARLEDATAFAGAQPEHTSSAAMLLRSRACEYAQKTERAACQFVSLGACHV